MPRPHPVLRARAGVVAAVSSATLVLATGGCSAEAWSGPLGALRGESESTATGASPSGSPGSNPAGDADGAPSPSGSPVGLSVASSSTPSPIPSPAPTPTPTPTVSIAVLAPPDLDPARGYTYTKAPAAVVKAFAPVAAGYQGVLSAPTVRAVQQSSMSLGSAAAMTVEPSHLADPDLVNTLLTGLVNGMSGKGYTLRTRIVTVAGKKHNVVVAFRKGSTIAAWLHAGSVVTMVSSEPEGTVLAFSRTYLAD